MRRADPHQSVADSLQADVMRFMAIIAFCLIAILALVRSVTPVDPSVVPAVEPVVPAKGTDSVAAAPEVPARPEPAKVPVARVPVESAVPAMPDAAPAPDARRVPNPVIETPPVGDPLAEVSEPAPAAAPVPPQPAQAVQAAQEEGLSLRFASEQDFLRLVTRGRIQVFAFNGQEVLTIGADLKPRPASAPGEVHELLPETIPELMTGALARHGGSGFRWAVAMPDVMARQIRRYVDQGATGELIIDRFGEVRHRGA